MNIKTLTVETTEKGFLITVETDLQSENNVYKLIVPRGLTPFGELRNVAANLEIISVSIAGAMTGIAESDFAGTDALYSEYGFLRHGGRVYL